jgi:hypothetical protein
MKPKIHLDTLDRVEQLLREALALADALAMSEPTGLHDNTVPELGMMLYRRVCELQSITRDLRDKHFSKEKAR